MPVSNLIKFKRGTSQKLATIKANNQGEDGAFYLTIDDEDKSSRLYVGRSNGKIVPVNQGIYTVTAVTDLTSSVNSGKLQPGDFAYVTGTAAENYADGNILAYWTGDKWLQLNKVDVTDKYLASLDVAVTTTSGVATVKITGLDEQGTKGGAGDPLETSFTMQGANGVAVSNSGDAITVTGTSYELSSDAVVTDSNEGIIALTSNDGSSDAAAGSVTIKSANSDHVHITGAADNIEIDAARTTAVALSNEAAGFGVQATDSFGATTTKSTIDPVITYGGSGSSTAHFVTGNGLTANAVLDVYNKDEIDGLLKGLDALMYKGTVGTNGSYAQDISGITTSGMPALHIGDTFKLVGDNSVSYDSIPVKTGGTKDNPTVASTGTAHGGDLLIANGVETNGEITTLYYDIIEVEQGEDTTYTITASDADKKITVTDSHGTAIGGMAIAAAASNPISVSGTSASNVETVTVGHGVVNQASSLVNGKLDATVETAAVNADTVVAVTDITVDEFGHTTQFKTKEFDIVKLGSISESFATSASNNVATITNTPAATNSDSSTVTATAGSFDLTSQNLTVTAPAVQSGNPQVMVNFVWESF